MNGSVISFYKKEDFSRWHLVDDLSSSHEDLYCCSIVVHCFRSSIRCFETRCKWNEMSLSVNCNYFRLLRYFHLLFIIKIPLPRNEECASTCLWAGVYSIPSFQSCTRYLHCVHGFLFELECEAGEVFDHLTLWCQPAAQGRCVLQGPVTSSSESSSEEFH